MGLLAIGVGIWMLKGFICERAHKKMNDKESKREKSLKKRSKKDSSSSDCYSSANRKPDVKKINKKKFFWDREKFRCSCEIYFGEKEEQVDQPNFVEQIEFVEQLECIDQIECVEQVECDQQGECIEQVECVDQVEVFQVEYTESVNCVDPESIKFEF